MPGAAVHGSLVPAGTPRYMSPEHISGRKVDASADCWSLAVVAYEMLAGACPFEGDTLLALRRNIAAAQFLPLSRRAPGLAEDIDALFARVLAPEPTSRLTNPVEFASALRRLLDQYGDPVARILFVDDEPDFELLLRQRFRHQLRRGTHELLFARSGEGGLEELRSRPDIDVVFTDLNMPGMDGLEFLARVPEVNPLVRVVVLSAYGDMANIRAAMNRGAFDFICKPIDFDDLELTVARCVADVAELRRSLANREENGIVRLLLGQSVVERFINAIKSGGEAAEEFDAALLAVLFGASPATSNAPLEGLIEPAVARMQAVQAEVSAREGLLAEVGAESALVVFRGADAETRAIDTALGLRQRFLEGREFRAASVDFRAGIDVGRTVYGTVAARGVARVEHLVFGAAVTRARRLRDLATEHEILVSNQVDARRLAAYRVRVRDEVGIPARGAFRIEAQATARSEAPCRTDFPVGGSDTVPSLLRDPVSN